MIVIKTNKTQGKHKENTRKTQGKLNNKDNKVNKNNKNTYGEFLNVFLLESEYNKIKEQNLEYFINKLSLYLESTGKKYKSHYATILNWSRKDGNAVNGKFHEVQPEFDKTEFTKEDSEFMRKRYNETNKISDILKNSKISNENK
ncbi:MAG: hypothetical protein RLY43_1446 [Bacteroidota bacterium]